MDTQKIGERLNIKREELAYAIVEQVYRTQPQLETKYGRVGRVKCHRDTVYHLQYLAEAVADGNPLLFQDYIAWAKVMLWSRGVPPQDLKLNLELVRKVLETQLPADEWTFAAECLDAALHGFAAMPETLDSFILAGAPMFELAGDYLGKMLRGDRRGGSQLILNAVAGGVGVKDIYLGVFQPSQQEVGRLWQMNQISVAQEHFCSAGTQLVMSQLYGHIFTNAKRGHRVVATAVGGELHEIGVRMVADLFEMEGWDSYYIGANTPPDSLVRAVSENRADLVAISATITYHVSQVAELITRLRATNGTVKILVGGYPFNLAPTLWKQIGADGYAPNAQAAVRVGNQLVESVN